MRFLAPMAAALACLGASHAALANNLIKDGGFETPATPAGQYTVYNPGQTLGAWTVVGSHDVNTSSTTEVNLGITLKAKAGQAFIDLTGDCDCGDPTTGVAQTVKTVVGQSYVLTFWVGNCDIPNAGTTSTINVYAGSTLLIAAKNANGRNSTSQVWKKFVVTFTATSTKTTLSFLNGDPSGDQQNGLDQVSLIAQ